jgi:hypothetical protein
MPSVKTKILIATISLILIAGITFAIVNLTSSKQAENIVSRSSSSGQTSQSSSIQKSSSSSRQTTSIDALSSTQNISESLKPVPKFSCELKPDDYTEIIDLENDCLAFSSRSMCDFDNKEPEIKELKPKLYDESIKLYNQYKAKLVSKYSLVVMSCEYVDPVSFEFGLNLYDQEYFKQKFGQNSEGPAIRFSKLYSAKKLNNIWDVGILKDTSYNFDNPPIAEVINTPKCLFPEQGNFRFQRIEQTDYGCYDFTIDPATIDLTNKLQDEYFTFRLYDLELISRDFHKDIYKDFAGQKLYIIAKDFNFSSDSKYTFKMDVGNNKEGKYAKKYTLEKKRNNIWVVVK